MRELPAESDAGLGGVVDLPFDELAVPGDSVFARSLRRRGEERRRHEDSIAGYDSCLAAARTKDIG
jgi:hypothetical protein